MKTAKNVESSKSEVSRDTRQRGWTTEACPQRDRDRRASLYLERDAPHRLPRTTRQKKKNRRKKINQMILGGQGRVEGRALIIIINNDIDGD